MEIRRAELSDVDAAVAIDRQERRSLVEAAFRDGHGRIARHVDEIVAFGIVTTSFFRRPFIELVVVHAPQRRRGIGRILVTHLVREHAGQRVFTSTNESNVAMRALLAAAGFTRAGRIEGLDAGDPEIFYYTDAA